MATIPSPKAAGTRPRARKSIAHMPSPDITVNKENLTVDPADLSNLAALSKLAGKKLRSKSIGPGGLDALKENAGNRRASALPPQIKSILKSTTPLSPPKQIPARGSIRASPRKANSGTTPENPQNHALIDTSLSARMEGLLGSHTLPNPFGGPSGATENTSDSTSPAQGQTRIAVRTEEEQQAAAKERACQELLAHKDARRKSLANRRVSFAPEATLHTWDTVELPEDSTTSSASTNSTRRTSALSANAASPIPGSDASEPPSTPPEQVEEVQVTASPAHQRDLHQKKRRRSSGIPPMNFNDPDEFSSSPFSGSSVNSDESGSQAFMTADEDGESTDSDDKDLVEDEPTVTGIDKDDLTAHSAISNRSNGSSSTSSSARLEEALRQAARQAGTQGIEYDENGDITMEMADDEVTAAFKPWMKKGTDDQKAVGEPSAYMDQENQNPFSPAFKANIKNSVENGEVEKTMDLTQAAGQILSSREEGQASPMQGRRKSAITNRRRSSMNRRRSSGDESAFGDETMELTTVIGGIQQNEQTPSLHADMGNLESADEDEELTMEFTSAIGGVVTKQDENEIGGAPAQDDALASQQMHHADKRRESEGSSFGGADVEMDITLAAGGILPSITERTEPPEDQTIDMDVTTAIGAILPRQLSTGNKNQAKLIMEQETDSGQLSGSSYYDDMLKGSSGPSLSVDHKVSNQLTATASETGSPSLAALQNRSNTRRSTGSRRSGTPKSASKRFTPVKRLTTPSKQLTPVPARPTTPGKTPPSKNVTLRTGSPKKLFKAEIKNAASPKPIMSNLLFEEDKITGMSTPSIVLKPRRRRSSGLGIDKEGLGSPRVTEILDRRGSIGEQAAKFVPQAQAHTGVRFEDPKAMEMEIDRDRVEDERRESGRGILQMEADFQEPEEEKDATTNLKDMIESLTPQKKRLNGRKSLHIGAAKGLLGKRPAELDEDDEDEDMTPKRLKGREGSPVKKVKLPVPPSKSQTTGRVTRSTRLSLVEMSSNARTSTPSLRDSPVKKAGNTTPKEQLRFKDAEAHLSPEKLPVSFEQKLEEDTVVAVEPPEEEDRVHLQDFLNMTSIRFMELTTTKRRHTVAPNAFLENSAKKAYSGSEDVPQANSGLELENCVVAGACIVPMLELYQHSCRELKKYITEGRSIVKEIEADTFEENPPLFREYMSASPDVRLIMDNQFKNVKTHARLLSKAMWYEWRMKLLEGLKEGLVQIDQGMNEDNKNISHQESLLQPILPSLIEEHEHLEAELQTLQAQVDELASCDQEELKEARNSLTAAEEGIEAKQKMIEDLQQELREKENGFVYAVERKQECLEEIKEAEKVQQECRGWSAAEVAALRGNVNALETAHGWSITSATGQTLTMTYQNTLQLFFMPSSFMPNNSSGPANSEDSPISLTYIADAHEYHPLPLTTEKRFFLQIMRAQLQCLPQTQTKIQDLLGFVSHSWRQASSIIEEARLLGVGYITESTITADEVMAVRSILLLRSMRTKIEMTFEVGVRSGDGVTGLDVTMKPSARVVYGEDLKERKVAEFLEQKTTTLERGDGVWAGALRELESKLRARGKK